MAGEVTPFRTVAIAPVACLRRGWELVGEQFWMFVLLGAVALLLASAGPLGCLYGPMFCGLFLCYFARMRGEPVSLNLLFTGFDFFVESLIATLLLAGVTLLLVLPLSALAAGGVIALPLLLANKPDPLVVTLLVVLGGALLLVLFLALQVLTIFLAFVFPLIADRKLKAVPAITTSYQAACANWWGLLQLALLNAVLMLAAVLCCYLPVLLVFPVIYAAWAVAYREIFPETPPAPPAGDAAAAS